MKVFILKPSSLGDVVQALPVLRLLKLHRPESEIFWWIDSGLTSLLEDDPDLSGVIPFHRKRWKVPWHWNEAHRSLLDIRRHHFDLVIDLQGLFRSGTVAWLANGKVTVGLDDAREGAPVFYDVAVPRPSYHTHAVDWYLAVLRVLDVPVHQDFTWLPERLRAAESVGKKWPAAGARWIALQPGARWSNKRWPAEYFVQVVRRIAASREEIRFGIIGSKADQDFGRVIAEAAPARCLDLTGQTSLPEMIEWLRGCELIVTNDTGPMHVAAALGKPVVGLFGPTNPRRTGPYGQVDEVLQFNLPCAPCMKSVCHNEKTFECLRAITPDRVVERIEDLLNRDGASSLE